MKLTCLFLDDDPLVLDLLQAYASMTDVLEVQACFTDPLEAHSYLLQHDVQLLFSDVTMPHLSGLDLVRSLRTPPLVVLMTSHPQYAMEGFNLGAIDFLLKPISFDRFLKAVAKVTHITRPAAVQATTASTDLWPTQDAFYIRTDSQLVRLQFQDVLYIEVLQDFTTIYAHNDRIHLTLVDLQHLEAQMPPSLFVRTHSQYLVNTQFIESISSQEVRVGGYSLPLAPPYHERVTERISRQAVTTRRQY